MTTILTIQDLSFTFHQKPIFKQAQLAITDPGVYGLVAPNGWGKTTLLKLIAGLYRPKGGTITLFDAPNTPAQVVSKIAYMEDISVLYPYLTAADHLDLIARLRHVPREKAASVAQALGVDQFMQRKVSKFSLGMKQRLIMAMTLMVDAPLMLLDEPLNGLDPDSLKVMRNQINAVGAAGKTVIVSSHNLTELARVTHTFIYLQNRQLATIQIDSQQAAEAAYDNLFH